MNYPKRVELPCKLKVELPYEVEVEVLYEVDVKLLYEVELPLQSGRPPTSSQLLRRLGTNLGKLRIKCPGQFSSLGG